MRPVYKLFLAALVSVVAAPLLAQDATAASPRPRVATPPHTPRPSTYGTSAVSYVEFPASSFLPWDASQTYTSDNFGAGPRWVTNVAGGHDIVTPLQLPSGARVVYLELDYYDNSATNTIYATLFACDYVGQNCTLHPAAGAGPSDCIQAGFICSGFAAADGLSFWPADISPDNVVIDNFVNSYVLLGEPHPEDGSTKLAGMIVGYVLQVSQAPLTATFTDVPTTHPQFQFVEALVASGITAGCGGGNYCPDSPLTRGQMAVYLAVALGLQWN